MATLSLELTEPLEQRIIHFKKDPEKMKDVNEFITELLEKACIEAETRQLHAKQKSKLVSYNSILDNFGMFVC